MGIDLKLLHGDVLSFARHYTGEPFHALLCDAPYELGFMNKDWDKSDISFRTETWKALGKLLYPGAFGMTFGGSRTAHRTAVAIEDAGFIIHPMIGWVYGSGFPKATRIDTQIDKYGGLPISREEIAKAIKRARIKRGLSTKECDEHFCGGTTNWSWFEGRPKGINIPDGKTFSKIAGEWKELKKYADAVLEAEREIVGLATDGAGNTGNETVKFMTPDSKEYDITAPATPLAQSWEGHRYGLQALKPALEPIIVFQKPYPKDVRPIDSITKTGAGALNIDGGRIGTEESLSGGSVTSERKTPITGDERTGAALGMFKPGSRQAEEWQQPKGRWPSNFVLTHSPDCQLIGYRDDSYQINRFIDGAKPFGNGAGHEFESEEIESGTPVWDCVDGCPVKELDEQIIGASRFFYQAKAGVRERNAGLKGFDPEMVGDGRQKSIDNAYQRGETMRHNTHTTIKPIGLTRHLATLLLPPEEYAPRRLLVPFAGTASEMIGAFQAGWECVIGIELEKEYVDIGRARLKYWLEQGVQLELL